MDEPTAISDHVSRVLETAQVNHTQAKIPSVSDRLRQAEKREQELQAWREQEQVRLRENIWSELVGARGQRYAKARLTNYVTSCPEQEAALARAKDYAANIDQRISDGTNLLLIGPAGTGKDHLMMGVAHQAVGKFKKVLWINGTSLWLAFREAIGTKPQTNRYAAARFADGDTCDANISGLSESDIIRKLSEVEILAISDPVPPRGPLTDYQAANLFDIIDARYSRMAPTLVTLNAASRKEAEDRLTAQTVDRIAHDAEVIICNWPSFRQKQSEPVE